MPLPTTRRFDRRVPLHAYRYTPFRPPHAVLTAACRLDDRRSVKCILLQGAGLASGAAAGKKRKKGAGGSVSEHVAAANASALTKALEDGTMDGDVTGDKGDDDGDDEGVGTGAASFVQGRLAQAINR